MAPKLYGAYFNGAYQTGSAEMVRLARSLAEEAGEEVVWPHIQEKYFEEAAEKLGIPDYRKVFDGITFSWDEA